MRPLRDQTISIAGAGKDVTPLWFWEHRYYCSGDIMGEDDPLIDWAV